MTADQCGDRRPKAFAADLADLAVGFRVVKNEVSPHACRGRCELGLELFACVVRVDEGQVCRLKVCQSRVGLAE